MHLHSTSAGEVVHGALAGMIGGAIAAWVMNQYITAQQQSGGQSQHEGSGEQSRRQGQGAQSSASRQRGTQSDKQANAGGQSEDATVKTAQVISRNLFEHELSEGEKKIAGPAVHYTYGSLVGGLYGTVAEFWPTIATGFGMAYGIALWALGDETAVPALRLGPPPTQLPVRSHADYLGAHLVYGMTLDFTRRVLRHIV